ncbi:MAPEG family protein [Pontibacter sp. JAM-7]|uniref:MAPEG family protein n=1 Tax=Pontibacter sp. JAM-7 TaxID=3366581 RepID=UPI003AF55AD9
MESSIFLPIMTLAGWTLLVLMVIPFRRFKAGFAGEVRTGDFILGESPHVPGWVQLANRNFMNLLEVPVLFYLVGLIAYLTEQVTLLTLWLAWLFVAARVLHSVVHLTYNRVAHRLIFFTVANLLLIAFWLQVFWGLI